ncbi:hypothetical protein [Nocardioides sp. PD653]|uniref:hypothetical protein n=1 Tax=Nocardioides sp. PD653 TaxID=393303 RepID=UPI0009F12E7C|nr:hypothetical protein [Nocardioides sp. PD653]GAW54734.1 hypothetical protein PD653_2148 [Nocardioides sp. PD653]
MSFPSPQMVVDTELVLARSRRHWLETLRDKITDHRLEVAISNESQRIAKLERAAASMRGETI